MSEADYSLMKVSELKDLCKSNSLQVSGKKAELIERLTTHFTVIEAILEHEKSPNNFIELDGEPNFQVVLRHFKECSQKKPDRTL